MEQDIIFLSGISFDDNPGIDEPPEEVKFYDFAGNEVTPDAVK